MSDNKLEGIYYKDAEAFFLMEKIILVRQL